MKKEKFWDHKLSSALVPVELESSPVIWAEKANSVKEQKDYSPGKAEGWSAWKSDVGSAKVWGLKVREKEIWTEEKELLALSAPLKQS